MIQNTDRTRKVHTRRTTQQNDSITILTGRGRNKIVAHSQIAALPTTADAGSSAEPAPSTAASALKSTGAGAASARSPCDASGSGLRPSVPRGDTRKCADPFTATWFWDLHSKVVLVFR